jgi:hypothetical protein
VKKTLERFSSTSMYRKLKGLARSAYIFSITTSLEKYENMLLRRVSAPRSSRMAGAVAVTLEFKEVRTASAKRTRLKDPPAADKKPKDLSNGAKVTQGPKPQPPAPTTNTGTFWHSKVQDGIRASANVAKGIH